MTHQRFVKCPNLLCGVNLERQKHTKSVVAKHDFDEEYKLEFLNKHRIVTEAVLITSKAKVLMLM